MDWQRGSYVSHWVEDSDGRETDAEDKILHRTFYFVQLHNCVMLSHVISGQVLLSHVAVVWTGVFLTHYGTIKV